MKNYTNKEGEIIKLLTKLIVGVALVLSLVYAKGSFDYTTSISYAKQRLSFGYINHAFFCPEDNLKLLLIGLINSEKVAVLAALYQITDLEIVQALINAKKRGVRVEIILDSSAKSAKNSKVKLLKQYHIPIRYYRKGFYSIMHNKFFIFFRTFGRSLVWTGSANATTGGTERNQENVVITQSPTIINRYHYKFNELKEISVGKSTRSHQKEGSGDDNFASLLQFLLSWFPGYSSF